MCLWERLAAPKRRLLPVTMYYNVSAANDITKSVNLFSHSVYLKATQMTATTYNCTTPLVPGQVYNHHESDLL